MAMPPKAADAYMNDSSGPIYLIKVPNFDPQKIALRGCFRNRTRVPLEKQTAELYGEFKGDAWAHAEYLDPATLQNDDGTLTLF